MRKMYRTVFEGIGRWNRKPYEIIVSDGMSTDRTEQIAKNTVQL